MPHCPLQNCFSLGDFGVSKLLIFNVFKGNIIDLQYFRLQQSDSDIYTSMAQWWRILPVQETQETQVQSLDLEDPLEKEMATHSSILAWRNPWTEEPGKLQSMASQRVGHD